MILPIKFQVIWPLVSREEVQYRISRWQLWWPSLIFSQNNFSCFCSTNCPDTSYQASYHLWFLMGMILVFFLFFFLSESQPDTSSQFSCQLVFWFREEAENRFSDWPPGLHWISNWNDFSNFDLQATLIIPTKFHVNWTFGSGEVQNIFLRWLPWRPSLISDWNDFSYFCKSQSYFVPSFESTGLLV